jgi:hypothetical protein
VYTGTKTDLNNEKDYCYFGFYALYSLGGSAIESKNIHLPGKRTRIEFGGFF